MSLRQRGEAVESRNPILTELADVRRRRILAILENRASPVPEAELAIRIAAAEREKPLREVSGEEIRSVRIDLLHVQLPKLEGAGLAERDEESETVTATNHPVFRDPMFHRILETEADDWDDVVDALADVRRRIALSVLEGRKEPIGTDGLIRKVTARVNASSGVDSFEPSEELDVSFRHVHLPKLEAAELIEYDPVDGGVVYAGHPALEDGLLELRRNRTL